MVTIESLINIFKPVFYFFYGIINIFQLSVWDLLSTFPLNEWQEYLIENFTGIDDKLSQFTIFEFVLGSGLIIVLVATVVNFFIDSIFPG